MAEVGYASLGIIPSFDGFERRLSAGSSGSLVSAGRAGGIKFGDAAGKSAGSRFGGVFSKAAKAALVGAAGVGVAAFSIAKDSINAASDLAESTNKVQQIFGAQASKRIFQFTKEAGDSLGQADVQARDAAATFGIFGKAAKMSDRQNARFAIRMSKLASDLASFNNTSPDQAIEALGAALRGEAEPIRSYGVLLDDATLKAEALRLGILKPVKDQSKILAYQTKVTLAQAAYNDALAEFGPKSIEALRAQGSLGTAQSGLAKATEGTLPPLTQQQKILAAQSSIMKQTTTQQGDFARTSDGLANKQRRLSAEWENAKAQLGEALLPMMERFVGFLLDEGIPAVEKFSKWFTKEGVPGIKEFADDAQHVGERVKDLAGYINDLPKEVKVGGLAALLAGGAAFKFRGLFKSEKGVGGAGTIGDALKVFVVNGGAGGGGGPHLDKSDAAGAAAVARSFFPKVSKFLMRGITAVPLPALGSQKVDLKPVSNMEQHVANLRVGIEQANDATSKLPRQFDIGKTSAEALLSKVVDMEGWMRKVEGKKATRFLAPGFDELLARVQDYNGLLDGLDGRTINTFIKTTQRNNDTGEGGGGQVPGRSGGINIENMTVKADDPNRWKRDMEHRGRAAAIGGEDFR